MHLARSRIGEERAITGGPARAAEHIDARADPHFDQTLDLEGDQRLAHGGSRHAELLCEIALGRQARAGHKFAGTDQGSNLLRDLPIQSTRLDALEGHGPKKGKVWERRWRRLISPAQL